MKILKLLKILIILIQSLVQMEIAGKNQEKLEAWKGSNGRIKKDHVIRGISKHRPHLYIPSCYVQI